MTKHLADHRSAPDTPRKKHFWAMGRRDESAGPHPAIRALSQRAQSRSDAPRLRHYLRIERGETA
ncbi:hypothetical protein [Pseudorhodobacter sp.]|uniref:hypothetical protein n=1 Tax=Pseudorhodobacter sp. TaxID=1934400 RepID=UPI0026470F0F|nr:hypothetical protein [Pseudorhodobacter sp.]MDN5785782.1 hypothetical protein [Pseudorhodobacter sp.]